MTLSVRAIATLGIGFGAQSVAYLGLWPLAEAAPPTSAGVDTGGGVIRSRVMRRRGGHVEREISTPDGPLIVLVLDDWTSDDLMTLTTALVLADVLH